MAIRPFIRTGAVLLGTCVLAGGVAAAQGAPAGAESQPPADHQHVDHGAMPMDHDAMTLFPMREASGTAWAPDATPMYGANFTAGRWQLMLHGNAFLQYIDDRSEFGDRGGRQAGSINWGMLMARRQAGAGRVGFRAMLSAEPATIRGCGYPDILASGELCDGDPINDRQHPHDLVMELAAEYDRPLTSHVRWQVYGGPAGEPALGPVAYPHRVSATPNPIAPIAHHWLDATHIAFGVVTTGVYGAKWKVEGSVFNGREPDDRRWDFDFGRLDAYSGRVWFLPTAAWAIQLSAGHLPEAEPAEFGLPRVDVDRVTASVTYHRLLSEQGVWASTVAWGRNQEPNVQATNMLVAETNLTLRDEHTFFGRVEVGGKSAHDLDLHQLQRVFTVAKLQGGYTHYLQDRAGVTPGYGAAVSLGIVPGFLRTVYGSRFTPGFTVFLTLRPAAHRM
jgi:hypothetical protein